MNSVEIAVLRMQLEKDAEIDRLLRTAATDPMARGFTCTSAQAKRIAERLRVPLAEQPFVPPRCKHCDELMGHNNHAANNPESHTFERKA